MPLYCMGSSCLGTSRILTDEEVRYAINKYRESWEIGRKCKCTQCEKGEAKTIHDQKLLLLN